jgi:hypothetical protein
MIRRSAVLLFSAAPLILWATLLSASPRADASLLPKRVPTRHEASGDKKRVPKPKDEPRYKPGSEDNSSKEDGSDDSGGCVGSCLSSGLTSLMEGLCTPSQPRQHSSQDVAASAPSSAQALVPENRVWAVHDHGWLTVETPGDSVMLLSSPMQRGQPNVDVGHLPAGAEVVVVETHALATGIELRVHPVDTLEPVGWIPGSALSFAPPSPLSTPSATHSSPEDARSVGLPPALADPPHAAVLLVLGGATIGNGELRDEYRQLGFRGVLGYQRYLRGGWSWGPSFGVRGYSGDSQVNYETPATRDEPGASTFVISDFALLAGQRHGSRSGFGLGWSVGPALYYVHETSDVETFITTTNATLGHHDEKLGRWAGGAVGSVTADWNVSPHADVGLRVDLFAAGWDGREQRSLTSDFIHAPLRGFDVSLSVIFPLH